MGLFTYKKRKAKVKLLEYHIDVDDITIDEFVRLKGWIRENIPSTERYTPVWNEDSDHGIFNNIMMSNGTTAVGINNIGNVAGGGDIQTVRFRFKYEEHAMAFKLIV